MKFQAKTHEHSITLNIFIFTVKGAGFGTPEHAIKSLFSYGVPNGSKATVPFECYFFTVRTVKFSFRTVIFTVRTLFFTVRTLNLPFERYFYRSNAIFYRSNGKISVRTVNSYDPFPIPLRRYCSYILSNQKSACISAITGKLFAV